MRRLRSTSPAAANIAETGNAQSEQGQGSRLGNAIAGTGLEIAAQTHHAVDLVVTIRLQAARPTPDDRCITKSITGSRPDRVGKAIPNQGRIAVKTLQPTPFGNSLGPVDHVIGQINRRLDGLLRHGSVIDRVEN